MNASTVQPANSQRQPRAAVSLPSREACPPDTYAPSGPRRTTRLPALRKEFIRPDQAVFAGDDAFRFSHILVRNAAYGATAKELRAELHEHFAAWLARAAAERVAEYEEILGYHLEQAYRYRAELGPVDEHGRALAGRAAERLAAAAERAMAREDRRAQVNLLSRAVALLPVEDRRRLELLPELGLGLARLGEFARSEAILSEAIDATVRLGDARVAARARVARVWPQTSIEPGDVAEQLREGERAIRVFEQAGDELGLSRAWDLLASLHHAQGQSAAAQEAWERSIEHARRAGSRRDELSGLTWLPSVAVWGPTPAADARRRCEEILEQVKGDLLAETDVLSEVGCLHAIEGRFDEARALHARRAAMYAELGLELEAALLSYAAGWVEMLAGDAAAAERVVRPAYQTLERMGARGELQVVGSYLAQAIYMQGRYQEAERLALSVEELDPAGIAEVAYARCARAKAAAKLGRAGEGARLAREAVALVDRTDFLIDRGEARMDLAEVLRLAGRSDEAADVLGEALRLHEKKGNVVSAERARALLAELGR